MKKFFRLLIPFIIIVLTALLLTSISASAASQNVIYISSDGTGDGSSPNSPLGNASGYKPGNKMDVKNAFYLGLDKLKTTGGTLVIVGPVIIDTTETRVPSKKGESFAPCEFRTPDFKDGVSLTVTSVYNGKDYRANGAKLVLDYDTCNTTCFFFDCSTNIENLNIEYKYDEEYPNSWNTPFMLGGDGNRFTINKGVNVTSFNTKTGKQGSEYPILVGGHRYKNLKNSTNITVKSGTWDSVIAGCYGITSADYGTVSGDANLTIEGGKIGTVVGTGGLTQPTRTVLGKVNITVIGGEIDRLYASHAVEYKGPHITLIFKKNAKIGEFFYAPSDYRGFVEDLIKKTSIKNETSLVITAPEYNEETTPPETTPPDQSQTNEAPEQTPPEETSLYDLTHHETEAAKESSAKEDQTIPPVVWLIIVGVFVIVGIFKLGINWLKQQLVK